MIDKTAREEIEKLTDRVRNLETQVFHLQTQPTRIKVSGVSINTNAALELLINFLGIELVEEGVHMQKKEDGK